MCPKRRRPPGVAIRGGRGVPRNRRENVRNLAGTGSSHSTAVDLGAINAAALACLPALVERWLPDGKCVGREWLALNPLRVDRRLGSFKVNLVTGKWADFALPNARGGDPVALLAYLRGCSQSEAARSLARMLGVES